MPKTVAPMVMATDPWDSEDPSSILRAWMDERDFLMDRVRFIRRSEAEAQGFDQLVVEYHGIRRVGLLCHLKGGRWIIVHSFVD